MDKTFREFQLQKELKDLEREKYPSDQDLERIKEINEELVGLRANKQDKQLVQDQSIPDIDYNDIEDINLPDQRLDQLIESIDPNTVDLYTLKVLKKAVRLKTERQKVKKDLIKLKEQEIVNEAELDELKKEKNFMQGKKNSDGIIPFRENVYQKRLKEATTRGQRFKLKLVKAQTKMHNAGIIIPRKINSATKVIGEISNSLGELGNQFNAQSGYKEPKGKKKSKQSEEFDINSDYGFNTKSIFNAKKTDW